MGNAAHGVERDKSIGNQLVVAQLGGCTISQICEYVPDCVCGPVIIRSATASLVSPPLTTRHYDFSPCRLKSKFMLGDFHKDFMARLQNEPWDVLVLDLLRDIVTGSVKVAGTCVTEFNSLIEGEPIGLGDVLRDPFEIIDWHHPAFFEDWCEATCLLFEKLLRPMMDRGRRIVLVELYPNNLIYGEFSAIEFEDANGERRALRHMLERMHAFFAKQDDRTLIVRVEDEYLVGAFDHTLGSHYIHMVTDFYTRAGELVCEKLGIAPAITQGFISGKRLDHTRRRYVADAERRVSERALAAERDSLAAQAESQSLTIEAMTAEVARLTDESAVLSSRVEEAHAEANRLGIDLASAEQRLSSAAAEHATLVFDLSRLGDELAHERSIHAQHLAAREAEVLALADELGVLRAKQEESDRILAVAEMQRAALAADLDRAGEALTHERAIRAHRQALHDAETAARVEDMARLRADVEKAALDLAAGAAERTALEASLLQAQIELADERSAYASGLAEREAEARRLLEDVQKLHDEQRVADLAGRTVLAGQQAAVAELQARLHATVEAVEDLRNAASALETERNRLKTQVDMLLRSSSWRVTAPLRGLKSAWLRFVKVS